MRSCALVVAALVGCAAPTRPRVVAPGPPATDVAPDPLPPEVDAAAPLARGIVWSRLPAPHELPADPPRRGLAHPDELRALVGRRTRRDATLTVLAWARELGAPDGAANAASPAALVDWAAHAAALASPRATARPGDLLVFERTDSRAGVDLVALVVAHDARGVVEYVYVAGGVVRRGFVDAMRPMLRRDAHGAVVNTYLRAGTRWPPRGTHYLAGELLAHIITL